MPLDLILGPANAGKVAELYRRYRACLADGRDAILVVPNGAAIRRAERDLLAPGALIGGRITTFDGLFELVVSRDPERRPVLEDGRRRVELARVVSTTPLPTVRRSANGPRFADAFARLVDRLASGLVAPDAFRIAAGDDDAAGDLALLYSAWWERLDALGRWDVARQRIAACSALERSLSAWHGEVLHVEGFEDLSHAQERIVRLASERAGAVVTMPYEPGRPAFAALRHVVARLAEHATVVELPPIDAYRPPRLAAVERTLFGEVVPAVGLTGGEVATFEVAGERAEADVVASEVTRAIRCGTPIDRIAVIAASEAAIEPVVAGLRAVGVPVRDSRDVPFLQTPFGFALDRLLAYSWDGALRRADLFAFLRSPWSGVPRRRVDYAESRLRLRAALTGPVVEAAIADTLPAATAAVVALRQEPAALAGIANAVRRMVAAAHEPVARPVAAVHRGELAAVRACLELLDALAVMDPAPSRDELRAALTRLRIRPDRLQEGRVLVCAPRLARGIDADVVVIIGLEHDGFGGAAADDGLLSEDVMAALPDAFAPVDAGDLDRHLLYVAVTRAAQRVVVGRRVADDDGRAVERSALFEELERSVGAFDHVARRGLPDVVSTVEDATSLRERLRAVVALSRTDPVRAERIADADDTARRLRRAQRAWKRRTRLADPHALAAVRASNRFAVTGLERFGDCSAWWFAERFLRPRDVDGAYDARLKGSVAHVVLQRFYKQVPATFGKERLEPVDADRAVGLIAPLVAEAMAGQALPVDVLEARIVARAVTRDLERFVHRDALAPSPLVPTRFEVSFGGGSAAPGLKDGLLLGDFAVTGKIDRIDTDPRFSAHALVQDYKSGKSADGVATMIARGRLQVPLYVLAARDLLGLEPIGGLYRALGPGGAARGVISDEAADVVPAYLAATDIVGQETLWALVEEARAVAIDHVRRIRAGDIRHDPRNGSCPSYCAYGEVCRVNR